MTQVQGGMATDPTLFLDAHYSIEKESDQVNCLFPSMLETAWLDSFTRPVPRCSLLSLSRCRAQRISEAPNPFVVGPSALLLHRARGCFANILQEQRTNTVAFAKAQWAGLCEDRD